MTPQKGEEPADYVPKNATTNPIIYPGILSKDNNNDTKTHNPVPP